VTEHPTPAALRAFFGGQVSGGKKRGIVRHLLSGCPACAAEVDETARFLEATERGRLPVEEPAMEGDPYEAPLQRAFAAVRLHGTKLPEIKKRMARLRPLLEEGKRWPDSSQQGKVAVYEAALVQCRALRHENPRRMIELAQYAVLVSRSLGEDGYTPEEVADFRARALGELANAFRVAEILGDAEDAMREAFRYAAVGTGDLFLKLRLKDLQASLLATQHRDAEAVLLLSEVVQQYLRLDDRQAAARVLLKLSTFRGHAGEPGEAVQLLAHAEAMIDETREPGLKLAAIHNRLYFLLEMGNLQEAMALLDKTRHSFIEVMGLLDRFKLIGIEGRIFVLQGQWDLAEQALLEAKNGLANQGALAPAAIIGLDLSAVVMRQGRHRDGLLYAAEALQEFTRLKLEDQKAEALLVLAEAIKQRLVTATLVQSVADFVRREHKPQDRYEPRFE
jgi:tetratricopeptide (TPR) repeat protein